MKRLIAILILPLILSGCVTVNKNTTVTTILEKVYLEVDFDLKALNKVDREDFLF